MDSARNPAGSFPIHHSATSICHHPVRILSKVEQTRGAGLLPNHAIQYEPIEVCLFIAFAISPLNFVPTTFLGGAKRAALYVGWSQARNGMEWDRILN